MKISHNWNGFAPDRTDPAWAERVEREARRTTDAAEADAARLAERLARAERRLGQARAKLRANSGTRAARRKLAQEVEQRRLELVAVHDEMRRSPAGSQHRGRGSYRSVPDTGSLP